MNIEKPLITSMILLPCVIQAHTVQETRTETVLPNVIIILADDLGYGDLQCYGAKNVATPHTNQLAASGIRFTNAHATAATSTPSRYALLTGEYAWRREGTDVAPGDAAMIIKPSQFTMADLFKSVGYATAAIGKWHLGLGDETGRQDWNAPLPQALGDLGFDYHYIMAATADRVPCVFIENGKVCNLDEKAPIEVSYQHPFRGEPTGKTHPQLLYNQRSSHGHDMAIVNGIGRIGYMKGGGKALWKDEDIADSITAHAVEFIRSNSQRPFFLYFATNDVHVPRFPHQRFRGVSTMGMRGDAIAQFDWSVGQIMQTLSQLHLTENTLVILTSDNGAVIDDGYDDHAEELLGGHQPSGPYRGYKYSSFEGGTTVPMIVSWPKIIKPKQTSDALFSQIDLFSTLKTLVRARIPNGHAPDSRAFPDALLGRTSVGCPYLIEQSNTHVLSVRTPKWKYIEPSNGPAMIQWGPKIETGNLPTPQLYDISADVSEQKNVASHEPQVLRSLQKILHLEREKGNIGSSDRMRLK